MPTPRDWDRARSAAVRAGMVRNIETAPTFDRLFRSYSYLAPRLESTEDSEAGTVLVARPAEESLQAAFDLEYDPFHSFTPDPGLFEKFLRLSQKDEESVVRFAARHGMLKVCPDHCRPFPHSPRDPWDSPCEQSYRGRELATDWIRVAMAFRAAVLIAAKLQRKELPSADDWVPLLGEDGIDPRRGFRRKDFDREAMERSVDRDWAVLGSRLNTWWSSSLPEPELRFLPKLTVEIDLRAWSLFGLLVRELAFIVAKVEGFAACAGCGALFSPKRRPAPGQRSWCGSAECRRVQFRLSKAAQRSRQKTERRKTTSKGRS